MKDKEIEGKLEKWVKYSMRYRSLKYIKYSKYTLSSIGCTMREFRKHIESMFTKNMNWDNYGSVWCFDHIIPVAAINDDNYKDILHYSNIRPILESESRRKGCKPLNQQKTDQISIGKEEYDKKVKMLTDMIRKHY